MISSSLLTNPTSRLVTSERTLKLFSTKGVPRQYLRALYGRLIGNNGAESWLERSSGTQTLSSIETLREMFARKAGE